MREDLLQILLEALLKQNMHWHYLYQTLLESNTGMDLQS